MGILETLLGSNDPPDEPDPEPTINLPADEYTVAYPVAVRHSQLSAFQSLIDADRDTPHLDGPGAEMLIDSLNNAWKQTMPEDETWHESIERTRETTEEYIQTWLDDTAGDIGVVFLPVGGPWRLRLYLETLEIRAEGEEDPFSLPNEFIDATALIQRLQHTEENEQSVVVHKDRLPHSS